MADIFLSHVEEDFHVVKELVAAFEARGYSTWYYEEHSLPGIPHPAQTRKAIEDARAFLLLISPNSLAGPRHVKREVMRAVDLDKPFVPLLLDISFAEFAQRQPEWEDALAGAVATTISPEDSAAIVPRVVAALKQLGIEPGAPTAKEPEAPPRRTSIVAREPRRGDVHDLFLSHVEADFLLATELAAFLEAEGFSTWHFERDAAAAFTHAASTRTAKAEAEETGVTPVVALVNRILSQALEDRASEIHIDPAERDLRIEFRIDGVLRQVMQVPRNFHAALISRVKIMADLNISEELIQGRRVALTLGAQIVQLRVVTHPTAYGEKVILWIVDESEALRQVGRARGLVALVSEYSLHSDAVLAEINRARSGGKPVLAVLKGASREQIEQVPAWAEALAGAPSLDVECEDDPPRSLTALTDRLKALGIEPDGAGRRLELVFGDITEQEVDAIVNAANPTLMGGGGVDGAIHRKGGPEIRAQCQQVRKERYPSGLPTGEATATTAGALRATWVIHTVGPVHSTTEDRSQLLASCHTEALRVADDLGARSIAFPAISTGAYGYPLDEAAPVAIRAVMEADTKLELIRFVLIDGPSFDAFERAFPGRSAA